MGASKKNLKVLPAVPMFEAEGLLDECIELLTSGEASEGELEGLSENLFKLMDQAKDKRDAVAYKYIEFCKLAEKQLDYAKMFNERAKVAANKAERLREMVLRIMRANGRETLEGEAFRFKLATNPSTVEVEDVDELPEQYVRTKTVVEADKVAIKAALAKGEEVPGAELVEGKQRVDVKLM